MKLLVKIGFVIFSGMLGVSGCQSASNVAANTPPQMSTIKPAVVASNASLGSDITTTLSRHPQLRGSNIGVSISNLDGTVTLTGTVPRATQKRIAVQVAEKQARQKTKDAKVISQLRIQIPMKSDKSENNIKRNKK